MHKLTTLTSSVVLLPADNVDTDQIIPARFLKTTEKTGLGDHLFEDWRYNADGSPKPDFVLNKPESKRSAVLLAGANFGIGSSREHAPWALMDSGFRAVIATSFADILRNNSLKNGLLPVVVDPAVHRTLIEQLEEIPSAKVTIDLPNQELTLPTGEKVSFPIDPFSKTCLLNGTDELGYLLSFEPQIIAYEQKVEAK